jgi:hypothetical protein
LYKSLHDCSKVLVARRQAFGRMETGKPAGR